MKSKTILVVGASGTVGSELVRLLKSEGYNVRRTTSRQVENGATDQVRVDLATGEGVRAAFEGVDRAFLLSPPGYADHHAILSPLIQEAKRRGLEKVVLMTALGANASDTTPFRRAEIELERSGLRYNIIRPNWFLQNFNTFWLGDIQSGKILLPAGDSRVSFIDARDVAAVAARLLTAGNIDETVDNQAFDLTGPEAINHEQVASALSKATSMSITYESIEEPAFRQKLLGAGLPVDYVEFLVTIMGFLRAGYNAGITTNVDRLLGRGPRPVSQYARDYETSWT